jgi:hypothetical protein
MADTSDLLGSLMSQLGAGGVEQIARSAGVSGGDVSNVLAGALPAMMTGLTRNAASSGGANALLGALDRDHDGSILDDVAGFLGGGGDLVGGAGILGHVFGSSQTNVERAVSRSSGVDSGSVGKIMAMVAPLLMGSLGKAKRQQGLDASGLAAALGQQEETVRRAEPTAVDLFSRILDGDGDGSSMDDIVKMGSGLLGGLFGGKK